MMYRGVIRVLITRNVCVNAVATCWVLLCFSAMPGYRFVAW